VDPDEWAAIELGVIQRARLLNALLVDLYGEQRVLKDGVAAGAVFGNPHPAALRSIGVRDNLHLHFIAFDLARSADGRWWVLSDRTQARGRGLRARESRRVVAVIARGLRGAQCAGSRASSARSRSDLSLGNSDTLVAVFLSPGQSTQNISSTRTSRAISASTSSKARPHGSRRPRLFEDRRGLEARRPVMRRISAELCDL
jgi:uncharacterized circularly permuted ATP-grasp superfamily protein